MKDVVTQRQEKNHIYHVTRCKRSESVLREKMRTFQNSTSAFRFPLASTSASFPLLFFHSNRSIAKWIREKQIYFFSFIFNDVVDREKKKAEITDKYSARWRSHCEM